MKPARERFPNLASVARGVIAGTEWSALKTEARDLLDEVDRLHNVADEAVETRRPDYLARAVVAAVIVLLIAWTLGVLRLGQGMLQ
jgi:hypothetical protein